MIYDKRYIHISVCDIMVSLWLTPSYRVILEWDVINLHQLSLNTDIGPDTELHFIFFY